MSPPLLSPLVPPLRATGAPFEGPESPTQRAQSPFSASHYKQQTSRSRSSSMSQTSATSRSFSHYREPTVLEKPDAVDDIRDALSCEDIPRLAELAKTYGLPPSLRHAAWPLLLRDHPLVKAALAKTQDLSLMAEADLPLTRLRSDIKRIKRIATISDEEVEEIFAVVSNFLRRFGSHVSYGSQMIWVAEFLLNGEQTATRRPRKSSRSQPNFQQNSQPSSQPNSQPSSVASSVASSVGSAVEIPVATSLSPTSSAVSAASSDSDTSVSSFNGLGAETLQDTFDKIMLFMNETPEQYSDFVTLIRTYLPQVGKHFAREGVLGASGGDDWLVWWLRWLGIRAFPPNVLARLWDSYFAMHSAGASIMKQHLFNCVVLIRGNRSSLLELDQSECRQFLSRLPPCRDIEALLVEARTLAKSSTN